MSNSNNDHNKIVTPTIKWNSHRAKLRTRLCDCGAVAIDQHRMVVTGGRNFRSDDFSSVELFDSRGRGKTQQLSAMNIARSYHESIVHGDYLYVIGGMYGDKRSVERLNINNISTSEWEIVAPMKGEKNEFAAAQDDNYIYTFDRYGSERYDALTNKWEFIPPMKQPRRNHAAVTVGSKVYIFGGEDHQTYKKLSSMEIFDTQTQTWVQGAGIDMPIKLPAVKALVVKDRIIALEDEIDNWDFRGKNDRDMYIFDTQKKTWTTIKGVKMNILRDNFTVTVLQHDKIFIVGGVVKGLYLGTRNDMEYLNINDLGLTEGGKQSKKRSAENMIQNEVSSKQPTHHRGQPYQNPVKVEEDGEVNEISQASNEVGTSPPLKNHNEIPKYSSAKTLHQRVAFLEESLGLKDNSSKFKRRVEYLENNLFGKISSSGVSIVTRVEKLDNYFF